MLLPPFLESMERGAKSAIFRFYSRGWLGVLHLFWWLGIHLGQGNLKDSALYAGA